MICQSQDSRKLHDPQIRKMKELQHALCDFNAASRPDLINPNCHEVHANILIGNGQAAMDIKFLVNHNVTHLLNCAKEGKGCKVAAGASFVAPDLKRLEAHGISYLGLELSDLPNEDISKTFPVALDWMDQALQAGGRLLVNCWVGRNCILTILAIGARKMNTSADTMGYSPVPISRNEGPQDFIGIKQEPQEITPCSNMIREEREDLSKTEIVCKPDINEEGIELEYTAKQNIKLENNDIKLEQLIDECHFERDDLHIEMDSVNNQLKVFTYDKIMKKRVFKKDMKIKSAKCGNGKTRNIMDNKEDKACASSYSCDQCQKFFKTDQNLKRHLRTHTGERPYACNQCPKTFSQDGSLKRHLTTHTGEKPYSCNQCLKSFSNNSGLKQHLRTHVDDRDYHCSLCPKKFTFDCELKRHLRIHTGEKPFLCNQCPKSFSQNSSLKEHFRTHTGEKPYPCNECSKSFTKDCTLRRHLRTHTGEKPYICHQCPKSFSQDGSLRQHLKTHTR